MPHLYDLVNCDQELKGAKSSEGVHYVDNFFLQGGKCKENMRFTETLSPPPPPGGSIKTPDRLIQPCHILTELD